ncbi:hypothetical protein NDU88_004992 [Pleurodeles waltl]|uniref:Uncharacterized protein n=1 Tax=Pleurodeles waltl TaxID=8319 RepID=A0AAV7M9Y2_PLEWA|nr:hypothetical protein NDU88_004992 [Pleurodeles waltl]
MDGLSVYISTLFYHLAEVIALKVPWAQASHLSIQYAYGSCLLVIINVYINPSKSGLEDDNVDIEYDLPVQNVPVANCQSKLAEFFLQRVIP